MDYVTFDKLCKENGTTATAIALKLGLSKGNTSSWKKGGNPSADILIKIADELNCTVDVLLGRNNSKPALNEDEASLIENFKKLSDKDKGKVLERAETLAELAAERTAEQERAQCKNTDNKKAPLRFPTKAEQDEEECCYIDICALPAGAGTGVYLDESRTEPLKIVHTNIADRANYAIRVSGDSMEPKFHDGDIVLVETCPSINIGEIGIFIVNGEGFIKQYDGNTLISLNPKRKNIHLQEDDTVFCRGRVLGIAETAE